MDYLALVNKVINESGLELDELTSGTWGTPDAGRRMYPRIKRWVAEAWKQIAITRNEWEFQTREISTMVYARVKYNTGNRAAGTPGGGVQFRGEDSGFVITIRSVLISSGTWAAGTANGQIEFEISSGGNRVAPGEVFEEVGAGTGTFIYLEQGSYDFGLTQTDLSEILWATFTANQGSTTSGPVMYIPFENWVYQNLSFTASTRSAPAYLSQDAEGNVVFYPQSLSPFRLNFIYTATPQALSAYTDIPTKLHATYHDWIAWEALINLALYDKNPDLAAYALKNATFYRIRAERNLMTMMHWRGSAFNE